MVNPNSRLAGFLQPVGETEDLLKPSTGAEDLLKPSTGAEDLLKPSTGADWQEGAKHAGDWAADQAVDIIGDQVAKELRSQGYKFDIDWKGIKNYILGRDAQGNIKPMKSAAQSRKDLMKVVDKIPGASVRKYILSTLIKGGIKLSAPVTQAIKEYISKSHAESLETSRTKEHGVGRGRYGLTEEGRRIEGEGRGSSLREKEIKKQREWVAKHLQDIYDKADKVEEVDEHGNVIMVADLPTDWYRGIRDDIVASNEKLFPDGLDAGKYSELLQGKISTIVGPHGKRIKTNRKEAVDRVEIVDSDLFPVTGKKRDDADEFREQYVKQYKDIIEREHIDPTRPLDVKTEDPSFRYLNFIRLTRPDLVEKMESGKLDFSKFFDVYNPDHLYTKKNGKWAIDTTHKFGKDFKKFIELDDKRLKLIKLPGFKPLLAKIFPEAKVKTGTPNVTLQVAHAFESSGIEKGVVQQAKAGQGGAPGEMYLDVSILNIKDQKNLEKAARVAHEKYIETGDNKYLDEIGTIHSKLKAMGGQGQVVKQIKDERGNVIMEPGFILGEPQTNIVYKLINMADQRGVTLSSEDFKILEQALDIVSPEKKVKKQILSIEDFNKGGEVRYMNGGGSLYEEGQWSPSIDPSDRDWDVDVSPYHDLSPWMDIDDLEFLFESNLSPDRIMEVLVQNGVPVEKAKAAVRQKVMTAKDGGIVQYFKEGTDEEGVTAGPISGFDVKPFIPPGARFDEDPLTLGDIGKTASEVAETAWPYMVPGVGEHLSAKDYAMFSEQAGEAWKEGKYPAWLGATILGTVALGGTYPNWTVVGAVPNVLLGAYKGVKKAVTKPKKIAPPVPKEERFVIKDSQHKTVDWKKTQAEADEVVSKLSAAEGGEFSIIKTEVPIHMPAKIKKKKPEKKTIEVTPEMAIGTGNNRTYYSKLDEILTNPTGNMRVKTGDSGNVIDIPINEVSLTAKEWHNTLRMAGIKESELVDSYIRQYLNKMGAWDQAADGGRGAFTSNAKIGYQEIKALADESPSRFLQTSSYSTKDRNLKYGSTGRSQGYNTDTAEEHILWIDSKDIKGDTGKISDDLRGQTQDHAKMKEVSTDVNFAAKNKLEGEPYIIGWSLVDERPGKLAGGKTIKVSTASEIQSDFLQMLQKKKTKLKKQIKELQGELGVEGITPYQTRVTERGIKETQEELANLIRPLGLSDNEINKIITSLTKNQQIFHKASKLSLDDMTPAVFKELDLAAKERDAILLKLHQNIDQMTLQQAFPNVPLKDQKEWVDAIIKNDIAMAAKKRFYFDENGVIQVNKNAPSHYTVSPSKVVKKRWSVPDDQYGMHVAPNMRTTEQHGKGVAYDLQYGGPKVVDHNGNAFRGNAEETLRKIAANKNAEFSIGKVNFGGTFEDSFLIELTPEMLTPYIQYFKHGGLVEAIPYNPLRSVLDALGPIGAY